MIHKFLYVTGSASKIPREGSKKVGNPEARGCDPNTSDLWHEKFFCSPRRQLVCCFVTAKTEPSRISVVCHILALEVSVPWIEWLYNRFDVKHVKIGNIFMGKLSEIIVDVKKRRIVVSYV